MAKEFYRDHSELRGLGIAAGGGRYSQCRIDEGQFDAVRFAHWCGITKKEYVALLKTMSDPKRKYVKFSLVDRIVTCVLADPRLLAEWYPFDEETGELLRPQPDSLVA